MEKNNSFFIDCIISVIALGIALAVIYVINNSKKVNIYEVVFESNGGTLIESQNVKEGNRVVEPMEPVKEGYIFTEWTNDGITYDFSFSVTTDLILEAEWIEKPKDVVTYVVKFNSNGGTTFSNQVIEKGGVVKKPNNPTKEGYKFIGWTLNNKVYNFDNVVKNDLVLVAKWEKIKTPVNNIINNNTNTENNTNGSGDVSNDENSGDFSGDINSDNNTGGSGNSSENINGENNTGSNENNEDVDNPPNIQEPVLNKYIISFNSNGGSAVSSQTIIEGNKVTKPSNPTKNGYTFVGWTLNGSVFDFNTPVTKNLTLDAKWSDNNWEIDSDGNITKYLGSSEDVVIPDIINGIKPTSIKAGAFESKTMKTLTFASTITTVEKGALTRTNNPRLYRMYMTHSQFSANKWLGISNMSCMSTSETDLGTLVYASLGKSCSSISIQIFNIVGMYTIGYTSYCGSTGNKTAYIPTEEYVLKNPDNEGYTFTGWIGSNGSTKQMKVTIPIGNTEDKDYTATCKEHTWSIKLDYGNYQGYTGTLDYSDVDYDKDPYCGSSSSSCKYKYSQKVTIPYNQVKRSGYTFKGWATTTYGTVVYKEGETVSKVVSKDGGVLTLYARWTKD